MHLLLVDTDTDLLATLQRYLERAGYRVSTAESGPQCEEQIRECRPDVLVLEPALPDDWGIKLLKRYSDANAWISVPVVVLSRRSPKHFSIQIEPYHVKPISMSVLIESIEKMAHGSFLM
ncbi:response regulator [Novipirellula artificiosorum]|uniref:response regulator n=1 Tax=Novipirellula artificiosorum TaxID=2528016 RepID=UPI001E33863A|nr:response regulator [Novipirellula artificiosorum]